MYTISGSNLIVTAVLDSGEEEREEEEEEEKGRGGGDEEEMEGEGVYMLGGGSTSSGLKQKMKIKERNIRKSPKIVNVFICYLVKQKRTYLTA